MKEGMDLQVKGVVARARDSQGRFVSTKGQQPGQPPVDKYTEIAKERRPIESDLYDHVEDLEYDT
jgi:hypothetical protein